MAISEEQVYERLQLLNGAQFVTLVHRLHLQDQYISNMINVAASIIADEICKQARGVYGADWVPVTADALNAVMAGAKGYFEEKLGHIKDFLVEPPEPVNVSPEHQGTVKELRQALKEREKLEEPQLVKVKGTLFPAALLTAGWWERVRSGGLLEIKWRNTLQQWLFEGFDLWAPSWDISWDLEGRDQTPKPYYVAQLTEGDEADSLALILPPKIAKEFRSRFIKGWITRGWCGLEVEVTGILGHRHQARKDLPEGGLLPGQSHDYCIWLSDDEPKHEILEIEKETRLYSGYLWKCLVPRQWIEQDELIGLSQVYIVWEHTNFAAKDALDYNLDSLRHKEGLIEKEHRRQGGLILLQKSHEMIIPGDPKWPVEDFYNLLACKKLRAPAGILNSARPRSQSKEQS